MTIENKLRCYLFYNLQVAYGDTFDSDENLVRRGTMVLNAEDWYYNEDKFGISEIINAENCIITRHGFRKRIVKPILKSMDDLTDEDKRAIKEMEGEKWSAIRVLEYLYLHHYDVHGLIGGKIAIDEKIFAL